MVIVSEIPCSEVKIIVSISFGIFGIPVPSSNETFLTESLDKTPGSSKVPLIITEEGISYESSVLESVCK